MVILNVGNPYPNPGQVFLHKKIEFLQKNGHKVIVFFQRPASTPGNSQYRKKGLDQVCYGKINLFLLVKFIIPLLIKDFKKFTSLFHAKHKMKQFYANQLLIVMAKKADIIHFDWNNQAIYFIEALKRISIPKVVSVRGKAIVVQPICDDKYKNKLYELFNLIDGIHSISRDLVKYVKKLHPDFTDTKIKVIKPAVDLNEISFYKKERARKNELVVIVTVAHLVWKKNIDSAIYAIAQIVKKNKNVRYKIIGDGPEREKLNYLIYALKLEKNVSLLGHLSHEKVLQSVSQADIFLMPSIQEGFCNAVLEAQGLGLPAVVADAEGLPENVLDGQTGIVYNRWSNKEMIKSLEVLIHNEELRQQLGNNAKRRVASEFRLESQVKEFIDFYQRLIIEKEK